MKYLSITLDKERERERERERGEGEEGERKKEENTLVRRVNVKRRSISTDFAARCPL